MGLSQSTESFMTEEVQEYPKKSQLSINSSPISSSNPEINEDESVSPPQDDEHIVGRETEQQQEEEETITGKTDDNNDTIDDYVKTYETIESQIRDAISYLISIPQSDLESLILSYNFTREEILSTKRLLFFSSQNKNTSTAMKDLLDENQNNIASVIYDISLQLQKLRFLLVPSKISEYQFWICIFYLLHHASKDNNDDNIQLVSSSSPQSAITTARDCKDDKDHQIQHLQEKLALAEKMILNLKKELQKTRSISSSTTSGGGKQENKDDDILLNHNHRGRWIMDRESSEFLSLDDDIKEQLRSGKQKRLQDVRNEVKFVLDTDHISSTYGKWECCGKDYYFAKECSC